MRLHHSPLIYLAIFCMLGAVISQDASQDTNTEAYAFNYLIKLSEMHFEGQWHSTSGTKQFGSYEESSGFMFSDTYNSCTIPGSGFTVAMLIYDGQYVNTDGFKVSLCHMFSPSFRFDSANAALIGTDVALKIDTSKVFFTAEQIPSHECPADISIHFIDRTSNQPLTGLTNIDERASDIGVQFFVSSPKCHISFTTDVLTPSQRTNIYSEIFISVVYAALVLYEARYLWEKKNVQSSQLSIMSFSWRIICGGMLAFTNLSLVARGASTVFLISIAITVLETFMFYIVIDKETTKIKSYIFSCLPFIAAIWIFGMYFNIEWLYITASFYLAPQIIGLYKSGERRKFSMKLIYIPLLPQIFLLAYLYLNPYNMARQRPNVLFFFAYAGLVAIQVFIIRFQGKGRRPKYQPQENEMGPIASEGVESA